MGRSSLLVVEPIRQVALAIDAGSPDINVVFFAIVAVALALMAVDLLALPSVSAYISIGE